MLAVSTAPRLERAWNSVPQFLWIRSEHVLRLVDRDAVHLRIDALQILVERAHIVLQDFDGVRQVLLLLSDALRDGLNRLLLVALHEVLDDS